MNFILLFDIIGLLWSFISPVSKRLLSLSFMDLDTYSVTLSKEWQVLGPFQIGTRGMYLGAGEAIEHA